jgi:hypothetical protein
MFKREKFIDCNSDNMLSILMEDWGRYIPCDGEWEGTRSGRMDREWGVWERSKILKSSQ